mmetsp:Transcript_66951/g.189273  ORF Transcript_66951/g.189273 Transcript_66951/m.189273 type:complete len:367 (-) Transcript_66951:529-1629(-)
MEEACLAGLFTKPWRGAALPLPASAGPAWSRQTTKDSEFDSLDKPRPGDASTSSRSTAATPLFGPAGAAVGADGERLAWPISPSGSLSSGSSGNTWVAAFTTCEEEDAITLAEIAEEDAQSCNKAGASSPSASVCGSSSWHSADDNEPFQSPASHGSASGVGRPATAALDLSDLSGEGDADSSLVSEQTWPVTPSSVGGSRPSKSSIWHTDREGTSPVSTCSGTSRQGRAGAGPEERSCRKQAFLPLAALAFRAPTDEEQLEAQGEQSPRHAPHLSELRALAGTPAGPTCATPRPAPASSSGARGGHSKDCRCKTLKLMEEPNLSELTAEVIRVAQWLPSLVHHDGDVDLEVDGEDIADLMANIRV